MVWGWIVIAIIVIIAAIAIAIYNGLVGLRNRMQNAWAQIDVQLKRRADLIPNLVESVKGYMKHERSVFENVTKARSAMMQATSVREKAQADNMLTGALKTLFAVAENYPQLRASENFSMLQEELSGTESKIAYARQFYNDSVMSYNVGLQTFPNNLVAGLFGFKQTNDYFEAATAEKAPVKVKFE
jgi:LemA protein